MFPELNIVPFQKFHQQGIDKLMESIVQEFAEQIYSPASKKITEAALLPGRTYWVAVIDDKVIGTVGFISLPNACGALKSMMLDKAYRSDKRQIAQLLLQTVTDHAIQLHIKWLYLGTMAQFAAAQRFYEKQGFVRTDESELPENFPSNPVDTVFYKRKLIT